MSWQKILAMKRNCQQEQRGLILPKRQNRSSQISSWSACCTVQSKIFMKDYFFKYLVVRSIERETGWPKLQITSLVFHSSIDSTSPSKLLVHFVNSTNFRKDILSSVIAFGSSQRTPDMRHLPLAAYSLGSLFSNLDCLRITGLAFSVEVSITFELFKIWK